MSAVVRAEALRAEHHEPAPEWGLVRDQVNELGGVLDLSGPTASIVLPVPSTTRRRGDFVLPFDAVALGREGVDPESTASCLSGAAKRLGLSEEACERLVSRSLLVGIGQPPLATPSFLQAEPERVTLHTAEKGDHALFVTETSTRVIAFWEPMREASVDARPLVAGAA